MTRPDDLELLAALDYQRTELEVILAAVGHLRRDLVPVPETSWTGTASRAYADTMLQLGQTVDRGETSLRSALALTSAAIRSVTARV